MCVPFREMLIVETGIVVGCIDNVEDRRDCDQVRRVEMGISRSIE